MRSGGGPRLWLRWTVVIGALLIAVGLFAWYAPIDIRPDGFSEVTPESAAAGARRLAALREAHGADAWEPYRTMEVVFVDEWPFAPTRIALNPWAEPAQRVRAKLLKRSWTTEFELLDGEERGDRWGLQSWKTWKATPEGEPVFDDSWLVAVTVAGLRYFIELPFVQDTATVVADAGPAEWNGKRYERLYVTWKTHEPQREYDQYVLWIDPDTGLVARVDFTIRALAGAAAARATFRDYRSHQGAWFPSEIVIDGVLPTGHTLPVHTIRIEDVQWDTVTPESLQPDPSLPEMGEAKPETSR